MMGLQLQPTAITQPDLQFKIPTRLDCHQVAVREKRKSKQRLSQKPNQEGAHSSQLPSPHSHS